MPIQRINKRTPVPKSTDGQRPIYAEDVNKIIDVTNDIESDVSTLQSDVATLQSEVDSTTMTTGITAFAGGGQANATQLNYGWNEVTVVASNNDSVKLPEAVAGKSCVVDNSDESENAYIFPKTGENIAGLSANQSVVVYSESYLEFICKTAGTWQIIG